MKILQQCLWTGLLLIGLVAVPHVSAQEQSKIQNFQVQQYYDASSHLSIQEVIQQEFSDRSSTIRRPYESGALWLKLIAKVQDEKEINLHFENMLVDNLSIYRRSESHVGNWDVQELAVNEFFHGRKLQVENFLQSDGLMVVYLRVASQAAKQFNVILLTDAEALKFENKKLILLVSQLSCSAILIIWVFLQISVTREITFLAVLICVSLFVLSRLNLHGTFVTQNSGSLQFFLQVNLYVFCMLIISMHWMIRIGFQEVTFTLKRKKELIYLSLLGILAVSLLISFNRYFVFLICIVLVAILTGLHAYDLVAFVVSRKLKWMDVKVHTLSCFINFFFVLCPALYYTFPQSLSIEFDIPGYRSYFFPVIGFAIMLALGENHKKRTTNVLLALMKANTTAEIEAEKRVTQQIFLSMLLHEIKTPLSVIRFGADAFKRMATGIGDQTVWANRVEMATQSIDKILEKCTQADSIDYGLSKFFLEPISVNQFLTTIVHDIELANPSQSKRIQIISNEIISASTCVNADAIFLKSIFDNLLTNALKYSAVNSQVFLTITQAFVGEGARVTFTVKNQIGKVGLPDSEKLFTRYYRSEDAKGFSGTGLGLWLSKIQANHMGSTIEFTHDETFAYFSFQMALTLEVK